MITHTNNMDIQEYTAMLLSRNELECAELMQGCFMPIPNTIPFSRAEEITSELQEIDNAIARGDYKAFDFGDAAR